MAIPTKLYFLWYVRRLFNILLIIVALWFVGMVLTGIVRTGSDLLRPHSRKANGVGKLSRYFHHGLSIRDELVQRLQNLNSSQGTKRNATQGFPKKASLICVRKFGRLGNQMFQVAAMLGVARTKGMKPFLSMDSDLVGLFQLPDLDIRPPGKCEQLSVHHEIRMGAFDEASVDIKANEDVALAGYFQSWLYFQNVSGDIRRQFTLRRTLHQQAVETLSKAAILQRKSVDAISESTFISVHVRRGDMLNPSRRSTGNNVAPASYLRKAMDYFRRKFSHVMFVASSDDMNWVKSNVPSFDTIYLDGNRGYVDFAILSLCEHSIMTVGSFGWWVSWLVGGTTIYYKNQYINNTYLNRKTNMTEFIYPGWIAME